MLVKFELFKEHLNAFPRFLYIIPRCHFFGIFFSGQKLRYEENINQGTTFRGRASADESRQTQLFPKTATLFDLC